MLFHKVIYLEPGPGAGDKTRARVPGLVLDPVGIVES